MTLQELVTQSGKNVAEFARQFDCTRSYFHHVLAGRKSLSHAVAIRIYRETGHKLAPIADMAEADIEVFERHPATPRGRKPRPEMVGA